LLNPIYIGSRHHEERTDKCIRANSSTIFANLARPIAEVPRGGNSTWRIRLLFTSAFKAAASVRARPLPPVAVQAVHHRHGLGALYCRQSKGSTDLFQLGLLVTL